MKKICSVLPMILALGLSAGVMTAFRACPRGDEGMWMHCHDAQILIFVIGLFMAAGNHWHAGRSARRGLISKNCL